MGKSVLFINACVRVGSRTKRLADAFLERYSDIDELRLWEVDFPVVDEAYLSKRDSLIFSGQFDDPFLALAKQFASAEEIVIAAPFWDLSFPASLKQYIEVINAIGVTFTYSEEGLPVGLCKADKLTFITTSGGEYFPEEYGFGYINALCNNFYGIKDVELISVNGLDIVGVDSDALIEEKVAEIKAM